METTFSNFYERKKEIDLYFSAIKSLYNLKDETKQNKTMAVKYLNDDFLKTLKSNALIMIYNLVESTIMGGILEIYDDLKQNGITYKTVREEIQKIWFSFKFNQVYDKNAHHNSYKNKAIEIINAILNDETISLDRKATDISGNLDADKIRQICDNHGITYTLDPKCRGGCVLLDIKEKRNDLAHGTVSFVECGRNYSIETLNKTKEETYIFLSNILDGMKKYHQEQLYRKTS